MYETDQGVLYCPSCGRELAQRMEHELAGEAEGKPFIKVTHYLICSQQNCPMQFKRQPLPKV